jgi:hypothetical protein
MIVVVTLVEMQAGAWCSVLVTTGRPALRPGRRHQARDGGGGRNARNKLDLHGVAPVTAAPGSGGPEASSARSFAALLRTITVDVNSDDGKTPRHAARRWSIEPLT